MIGYEQALDLYDEERKWNDYAPAPSYAVDRFNAVQAMHHLVYSLNDENAYFAWIELVPDCPTGEDLMSVACDDELFEQTVKMFRHLFLHYAPKSRGGLYIGGLTY